MNRSDNTPKISFGYRRETKYGPQWALIIDGRRFATSLGHVSALSGTYFAHVYSSEIREALGDKTIKSLLDLAQYWRFEIETDWRAMSLNLCLNSDIPVDRTPDFRAEIRTDPEYWDYPWSVADFGTSLKETISGGKAGKCEFDDGENACTGIYVTFPFPRTSITLSALVQTASNEILESVETAKLRLIKAVNADSLIRSFKLPDEHLVACKQYLVYFSEFLGLVGVSARTEITDQVGSVLFAVTPKDGQAALSRVNAALDLFLALPSTGGISFGKGDVRLKRLLVNVEHFREMIDLEETPDCRGEIESPAGGCVPKRATFFWGGKLAVKKWTRGPFELDLPAILDDLIRRFPIIRKLQ
ncbi:hypothetical protein [Opitutus sp. ER46]|uniref:hypothetical protein n=1 Tax=Opitutus sp. ER46 TaxID=2161864 RepID=UPI0011B2550A|nr:hypothetical protein [Opitutus sp. ER46]